MVFPIATIQCRIPIGILLFLPILECFCIPTTLPSSYPITPTHNDAPHHPCVILPIHCVPNRKTRRPASIMDEYESETLSSFPSKDIEPVPSESERLDTRFSIPPYFIENDTNLLVTNTTPPPNVWTKILPPTFHLFRPFQSLPSKKNHLPQYDPIDVTTFFHDSSSGAKELLHNCGLSSPSILSPTHYQEALRHLDSILHLFQTVLTSSTNSQNRPLLKARIVASRGANGIKCPRWHVDHVPLRLICALEGPGVCYLQQHDKRNDSHQERQTGRNPTKMRPFHLPSTFVNDSDELDTIQANAAILEQYKQYDQIQASCGDVVLLMGKEWEEKPIYEERTIGGCEDNCCRQDDPFLERGIQGLTAAVHKSPDILPFQGRVLLTVDVVLD